jgi:hypothetical protein
MTDHSWRSIRYIHSLAEGEQVEILKKDDLGLVNKPIFQLTTQTGVS